MTHPFIAILKAREDAWQAILHEIIKTINSLASSEELATKLRTNPEEYVDLVWPFVTYCLLDPTEVFYKENGANTF